MESLRHSVAHLPMAEKVVRVLDGSVYLKNQGWIARFADNADAHKTLIEAGWKFVQSVAENQIDLYEAVISSEEIDQLNWDAKSAL